MGICNSIGLLRLLQVVCILTGCRFEVICLIIKMICTFFRLALLWRMVHFGLTSSFTLNRSMLNSGEAFNLALEDYFSDPEGVKLDKQHSTPNINSILTVSIGKEPISNISSMHAGAQLQNGEQVNLNQSRIIASRSIFNQPNKIFLLEGNQLLSIRYQFSGSQNLSFAEAIRIAPFPMNCTQVDVMEYNNKYYLVVACLHTTNKSTLFPFRFNESSSGFISNLQPLPSIDVKLTVYPNSCSNLLLYAFDQLYIGKQAFQSKILLSCSIATLNVVYKFAILSINTNGKSDFLEAQIIEHNKMAECISGSIKILQYQNGFLLLAPPMLRQFSYDTTSSGKTLCNSNFMNVSNYAFVASVEEREAQYVYIIFQDRIWIRQSYSPNYQSLTLRTGDIVNLNIHSYCIAHKFMALLFTNATISRILVYDLSAVYPKQVNKLTYSRINNEITLYSVFNFLQNGNYFFVFNVTDNTFSLRYYQGYQVSVVPYDSFKAQGNINLVLADVADKLTIAFQFRNTSDSTITQSGQDQQLVFRQVLNINLSDYVVGPLGHFYTYPNRLSGFQYINHLSEVDFSKQITYEGQSLVALSINNILNEPIFTFYYNYSIKTCSLNFPLSTRKISLQSCELSKRRKNSIESPTDIVVLSQGKYLQFDQYRLQWCALSRNNEFQCIKLGIGLLKSINDLQLVSYRHDAGTMQIISLVIYNHLEIMWVEYQRDQGSNQPRIYINYYITVTQLPILKDYRILELFIDQGYAHFLVLHFQTLSGKDHQVVVYDRPQIRRNSSSTLIGHVIQAFSLSQLQGVFCIEDILVMIVRENGQYLIKEYKITRNYRLQYNRQIPLFGHSLVIGGRHYQDENFIFLQGRDQSGEGCYLVYCPQMGSFNLLTHKLIPRGYQPILYAQQIGQLRNNSMGLNGPMLFALTLPNIIFKFLPKSDPTMIGVDSKEAALYDFNVSVVDNNKVMNILNYKFVSTQKSGTIEYDMGDIVINFDADHTNEELSIDVTKVKGSVMGYNLTLVGSDCEGVILDYSDVFTKRQCLLYYNSQQLGIMSDFVAVQRDGENIAIVVTDLKLFCVRRRIIPSTFNEDFNNLIDCKFEVFSQSILMYCENTVSLSRQIYNVTVHMGYFGCDVSIQLIQIPQWFRYDDFDLMFTGDYILFEIPIRYMRNKIYFKAKLEGNVISSEYSLLLGNTDNRGSQSEFQSIDTSITEEFFFLLEEGIGIYKLSDTAKSLVPGIWIKRNLFPSQIQNEELAYVKFLSMNRNLSKYLIVLQLGTLTSSFDIEINLVTSAASTPQQTLFTMQESIKQLYEYKQMENCYNSRHSESQNYNSLTIKICSYQPPEYYVFSNFISITNQSTNALIQFYDKSGSSNHPFRIDLIYSNLYSNDNFQIQGNSLLVGSLFNLLCYYDLAPTVHWKIEFNIRNQTNSSISEDDLRDLNCSARLVLYNNQQSVTKNVNLLFQNDQIEEEYWSYWGNWIQRSTILLILANTARIILMNRRKRNLNHLRKKSVNRLHSIRFEVMVKINSKKTA